jgi:hypothetical protein
VNRRCPNCGDPFEGEHWQKLCWSCWHDKKEQTARDDAYARGFEDGFAQGRAARQRRPAALPAALVYDLLQLVHPDHQPAERFDLANRATAALLALRGRS